MKRIAIILPSLLLIGLSLSAQRSVTLDECRQAARDNYPLAARTGLIAQTREATLEHIAKGWLPQVSAQVQGTLQSDVSALPEGMAQMLSAGGQSPAGISRGQYRVAIDLQQTLYDGGQISSQTEVARRQSELDAAQLETELYSVEQRAEALFFGVLLHEERLKLVAERAVLLADNLRKVQSMADNGTAAACEVAAIRAEILSCRQDSLSLCADRDVLVRTLVLLCGFTDAELHPVKPEMALLSSRGVRPELRALDARLGLLDANERSVRRALLPRLSLFAQGWYGYTGFDMFHDMMHRTPTLNGLIGVRLTWNISPLYTRRSDLLALQVQRDETEATRRTFLFNQRIADTEHRAGIAKWRALLAEDDEIVRLRTQVRQGAEARLQGGVVDVNTLVQEITRERQAKDTRLLHELQMLQEACSLCHNAYQ